MKKCAILAVLFLNWICAPPLNAEEKTNPIQVMWRGPEDISSRDLYYGPGGREDQPLAPFRFIREDLDGTNPKFIVEDASGVK